MRKFVYLIFLALEHSALVNKIPTIDFVFRSSYYALKVHALGGTAWRFLSVFTVHLTFAVKNIEDKQGQHFL